MNITLRSVLKELFCYVSYSMGAVRYYRKHTGTEIIILTYHSFTKIPSSPLLAQMPIKQFEQQLRYLKLNYHIIPLSEAVRIISTCDADGVPFSKPRVSITVDDGFLDNYTLMFPVIKFYNIPVAIFVATDFIDNGRIPWATQIYEMLDQTKKTYIDFPIKLSLRNRTEKAKAGRFILNLWASIEPITRFHLLEELKKHLVVSEESSFKPITWEQIREMQRHSVIVGSHSVYHSILPAISEQGVILELKESKQRIENQLDKECFFFSYPNGNWNHRLYFLLRKQGYKAALTQDWGSNHYDVQLYSLKRIDIPNNESLPTFANRTSLLLKPFGRRSHF